MEIILPKLGLFFWTTILFLVFFFILRKFAWKPILDALKQREDSIEGSLKEAQKAKEEMASLKADNENLLKEAQEERRRIVNEAEELKKKIVSEAKEAATVAAAKEFEKARQQFDAEKRAAFVEIKKTAANIAIEVAEKILRKEFENKSAQEALAQQLISDLSDN